MKERVAAAVRWLAGYDPGDGGGPVGMIDAQSDAAPMFERHCVIDAFVAGLDERLRLAAVQGDEAAWAARACYDLARGLGPLPRIEAARIGAVVEFLWNDLGEARRLVAEAAELFRAYEAHHRDIAKRTGAKTGREEKADRNARIAEKLERWLAGDGDSPAVVLRDLSPPGEDTLVARGESPLPEFDGTMVERTAPARSRPGWWDRVLPSRFINRDQDELRRIAEGDREWLKSNVRPVDSGHPLASFEVVGGIVDALDGEVRAISMADAVVFRLQTPDPRFDPVKPVQVNGYLYHPATEDLCKTN